MMAVFAVHQMHRQLHGISKPTFPPPLHAHARIAPVLLLCAGNEDAIPPQRHGVIVPIGIGDRTGTAHFLYSLPGAQALERAEHVSLHKGGAAAWWSTR